MKLLIIDYRSLIISIFFRRHMKNYIKYFIYCSPDHSYSTQESKLIEYAEKNELNIIGTYFGSFQQMLHHIQHGKAQGIIVSNINDLPKSTILKTLISKNIVKDVRYLVQCE